MQLNWTILLSSAAIIAASFTLAVLAGFSAAQRDAIIAERAVLAGIR